MTVWREHLGWSLLCARWLRRVVPATMSDDGDDSWDGHQVRSLILVTVGPLSLLGSLFILVTWAAFKALRTPNTLMLACLALSDLLCTSREACAQSSRVHSPSADGALGCRHDADVSKFVATGALYLAGSDVADENGSALCTFMGVLGQFMGLAAATWNTMIGTRVPTERAWVYVNVAVRD